MDKVFVGKLVTTHGVRGEVRILSTFEYKDRVFKIGNTIYVGNRLFKITSYRVHKGYDMVTFDGITNINEVIPLKGMKVYIERDLLGLDEDDYLLEDLIGMEVYLNDKFLGDVIDYTDGANKLIEVEGDKTFYIPLKGDFIKEVDIINNKILANENVEGLI